LRSQNNQDVEHPESLKKKWGEEEEDIGKNQECWGGGRSRVHEKLGKPICQCFFCDSQRRTVGTVSRAQHSVAELLWGHEKNIKEKKKETDQKGKDI